MTFISSNVVLDPDRLRNEIDYFMDQKSKRFVYDVETMGNGHPDYRGTWPSNKVVWMSMATQGRSIVIPMGHPNGDTMIEPPRRRKDPLTNKFVMTPAKWSYR